MYQASAPQFAKMLNNLLVILQKGEEFAASKGMDEKELVESRLIADMFPLSKQVQIACDQVKNGMARLAGIEPPKYDDQETTLAQLRERVTKTLLFLQSIQPEQIDGTEEKKIEFSIQTYHFEFVGAQYLLTWLIPNFYFHVTTTYDILRHHGVAIGKTDFLGG